jgi:hypothetical protein
MHLPHQSAPVQRNVSPAAIRNNGLTASQSIPCQLCMMACDHLSGIAKTLCQLACQHTVCHI